MSEGQNTPAPTPRTNKAILDPHFVTEDTVVVRANFARTLERENAALLAALVASVRYEEAKSARESFMPPSDRMKPGYEKGQKELTRLRNAELSARDEFKTLRAAALANLEATKED